MKMFEPVVIACDQTSLDLALPIRAALELYRLRAYLHFCVQKRNVLDFFAGRIPESKYVVLCGHGQISFHVVDEVDGRWKEVELRVVPENVPELVRLPGRRIVSTGCGNGTEALAEKCSMMVDRNNLLPRFWRFRLKNVVLVLVMDSRIPWSPWPSLSTCFPYHTYTYFSHPDSTASATPRLGPG